MFVGREQELSRVLRALESTPIALVYGLAGIGKSAFCSACAQKWSEQHSAATIHQRTLRGEPLGAVVDDIRRMLAGRADEMSRDADRISDLCRCLDETRGLLLLDDVHLLDDAPLRELVGGLSRGLKVGRVIMTSRVKLPRAGSDPDRVEVQLEALTRDESQALWHALDELYGAVEGFDQAVGRARGNPLLLRRAHAGGLEDAHPIEDAMRALRGHERRVAAALALSSDKLPLDVLLSAIDAQARDELAKDAIRALSAKLVVDIDGAGRCSLHDMFRDALLPCLEPEEQADIHRALAESVERVSDDLAVQARDKTRHLIAAGLHQQASDFLVAHGPELVSVGATDELRRALESIPAHARSAAVRLAHARCLVRQHDYARAIVELEALIKEGAEPRGELQYTYATSIYHSGELTRGVALLRELIDDPSITPALRTQLVMQYAWGLTTLGRVDEGVEMLAAEERRAPDSETAAMLSFYRAVALWAAERNEEMAAALERTRSLRPDTTLPFAATGSTRFQLAAMAARLGRTEDVAQLLAGERPLDASSRVNATRMLAYVDFEQGRRELALERMQQAVAEYHLVGNSVTAVACDAWVGRILLSLGRRDEGLAILERTEARAKKMGALGTAAACERSRRFDPLQKGAIIDGKKHELRIGESVVPLKRRASVRRILYALAQHGGAVVSKESLAGALWKARYHPQRHDNAIWVNIRRLRQLIEGTPLSIESDDEGYRLVCSGDIVFIPEE